MTGFAASANAEFKWDQFSGEEITVMMPEHPVTNGVKTIVEQFENDTGIKVDLQWFLRHLVLSNGVSMMLAEEWRDAREVGLRCDASLSAFGCCFRCPDGSIEWFAGERECHSGVPGCCSRADSDTWATANAADCHRVDRASTVYPWGDRDALCYMCLCNCQRTSATDDEHCAKTAIERTVPGFCDSFRAWEDVTEHWKLLASMFTVVVGCESG